MNYPLIINGILASLSFFITVRIIPNLREMFINAHLFGIDVNKINRPKIPESMGVVTGCIFLVTMFLFIPFPFGKSFLGSKEEFRHDEFVELIAALLSICCMTMLGFADDVLNLRWRHKLLLPTIASLPLLMVYYVNIKSTTIILPVFVRDFLGVSLDIGALYYVYMGMLAVFCTNAINILAGVNGLEVGQSIVIAISIILFNSIELNSNAVPARHHLFSMYLLMPYLATSLALWKHNRYPSQVFVGDTFCYLSGMTFAVVGILGHFSKTVLLFFIPQIINFVYSVPQLFHFVPCPRHRMPKLDSERNVLQPSKVTFKMNELNIIGRICVHIFRIARIIEWNEDNHGIITTNNFTLINFVLINYGPMHERTLTHTLIGVQIICSCIAYTIRYPLAAYFYSYT